MLQEVRDSFYVHIFKHPELEQSYICQSLHVCVWRKNSPINFVNNEFKVFFNFIYQIVIC